MYNLFIFPSQRFQSTCVSAPTRTSKSRSFAETCPRYLRPRPAWLIVLYYRHLTWTPASTPRLRPPGPALRRKRRTWPSPARTSSLRCRAATLIREPLRFSHFSYRIFILIMILFNHVIVMFGKCITNVRIIN